MRTWVLAIWSVIALCAFCGFIALGNWQVERKAWKADLLQRVDERIHAAATHAPARKDWGIISASRDEYRRIHLTGTFLHDKTALSQATTALGAGYWVITPMQVDDGTTVLINRGFVPQGSQNGDWRHSDEPSGAITITGLLRLSEPATGFLRTNDPDADRWHARNVGQIAASRGLQDTAPYFVDMDPEPILDAEQASSRGAPVPDQHLLEAMASGQSRIPDSALPVAGLTVVTFSNNHLTYILTWYGLALMVALASVYVVREERRLRKQRKKAYTLPL